MSRHGNTLARCRRRRARSRARFAQNVVKPEEVAPEWKRWRELWESPEEVHRFVERAYRLDDCPLEATNSVVQARIFRSPAVGLARAIWPLVASDGSIRIAFIEPLLSTLRLSRAVIPPRDLGRGPD